MMLLAFPTNLPVKRYKHAHMYTLTCIHIQILVCERKEKESEQIPKKLSVSVYLKEYLSSEVEKLTYFFSILYYM